MRHLLLSAVLLLFNLISVPLSSQNIYPVGSGLKIQGTIYALEYDPINGRLYAGGDFTAIGNTQATGIAYLENGTWHKLANGVDGTVFALKMIGSELYVGGYFETASGVTVNHIARWDGSAWHPLGSGTNGYGSVLALEWFQGKLYATGHFTKAGSADIKGVAVWDGNNWSDSGLDSPLHSKGLLVAQDTLWAYGSAYNSLGGNHHIASYLVNGSWNSLPELPDTSAFLAYSFVQFQGKYYAYVEGGRVLRWNGNSWDYFYSGSSPSAFLNVRLIKYSNNLWVVNDVAGQWNGDLELTRITGGALTIANIPGNNHNSGIYAALEVGNNLWLGGNYTDISNKAVLSLGRFDGTNWNMTGQVGGSGYQDAWNNASGYCIEKEELIVGGGFQFAGDVYSPNIAKWDGQEWQPMGQGFNNTVSGILKHEGQVYACGRFTRSGDTVTKYIAKWDGTSWQPIGIGADDRIYGLLEFNGEMYAWGLFTNINGYQVNNVAKMIGNTWVQVPGPWEDWEEPVYSLAEWQGKLVAATSYMTVLIDVDNSDWSMMGTEYLDEGRLYNFNGDIYFTDYLEGTVLRWDGQEWEDMGLTDENGFGFSKLIEMEGQLYCTVSNGGLWRYDGNYSWTLLSYLQPFDVAPLGNHRYFITGFFPWLSTNGLTGQRLFNHTAILDFSPPHVAISANNTKICKHQYVIFTVESEALYLNYKWNFQGGTPEQSEEAIAFVQYTNPGSYPVMLVASNAGGADTVVFASQITVIDDPSCYTAVETEIETVSNQFNIYPNPASGYLQITLQIEPIGEIVITDIAGRRCHVPISKTPDINGFTLDVSALPIGIYFSSVVTEKGLLSKKFIKI